MRKARTRVFMCTLLPLDATTLHFKHQYPCILFMDVPETPFVHPVKSGLVQIISNIKQLTFIYKLY